MVRIATRLLVESARLALQCWSHTAAQAAAGPPESTFCLEPTRRSRAGMRGHQRSGRSQGHCRAFGLRDDRPGAPAATRPTAITSPRGWLPVRRATWPRARAREVVVGPWGPAGAAATLASLRRAGLGCPAVGEQRHAGEHVRDRERRLREHRSRRRVLGPGRPSGERALFGSASPLVEHDRAYRPSSARSR